TIQYSWRFNYFLGRKKLQPLLFFHKELRKIRNAIDLTKNRAVAKRNAIGIVDTSTTNALKSQAINIGEIIGKLLPNNLFGVFSKNHLVKFKVRRIQRKEQFLFSIRSNRPYRSGLTNHINR